MSTYQAKILATIHRCTCGLWVCAPRYQRVRHVCIDAVEVAA